MSAFPMYGRELGWHRGKNYRPFDKGRFFFDKGER